ncbi:methylamine utilization protein MauF [Paracoccus sp. 22332]|uniref:methylamine utilization protein MauF n=1 Tax=Paracoccus sp. 22332 TaxID=3453913 RepID=UPI003F84BB49
MTMIEQAGLQSRPVMGDGIADCTVFSTEMRPAARRVMLVAAIAAGVGMAMALRGRVETPVAVSGLLAGLAFAGGLLSTWSPCGYSSLCLLRPSGRYSAQSLLRWTPTFLVHGLGYAIGAVILGLLLGGAGQLLGAGGITTAALLGIGGAGVLYGAHQLRLIPAPYPQRRAQVPHDARQRFPSWVVGAIYGLSLGLNYLTYVQTPILYLVTACAFLSGSPVLAIALFALFNLGRFLPMAVNYLPLSDITVQKWLARRQEAAALMDGILLSAAGALLLTLALI